MSQRSRIEEINPRFAGTSPRRKKTVADHALPYVAELSGPFTSRMVAEAMGITGGAGRLDNSVRSAMRILHARGIVRMIRPGSPREPVVWQRSNDPSIADPGEVLRLAGSKFPDVGDQSLRGAVIQAAGKLIAANGSVSTVEIRDELAHSCVYSAKTLRTHVPTILMRLARSGQIAVLAHAHGSEPAIFGVAGARRNSDARIPRQKQSSGKSPWKIRTPFSKPILPRRTGTADDDASRGGTDEAPKPRRLTPEEMDEIYLRAHRRERLLELERERQASEGSDGMHTPLLPNLPPARPRFSGDCLPVNPQFIACSDGG